MAVITSMTSIPSNYQVKPNAPTRVWGSALMGSWDFLIETLLFLLSTFVIVITMMALYQVALGRMVLVAMVLIIPVMGMSFQQTETTASFATKSK